MVSRNSSILMEKTGRLDGQYHRKGVRMSEHSKGTKVFTVCGVFDDFRIGSLKGPDTRASIFFYATPDCYNPPANILIKMNTMSSDNLAEVNRVLTETITGKVVEASVYKMDIVRQYQDDRDFRDAIMISGIVTLIIALIGLIGIHGRRDEPPRP